MAGVGQDVKVECHGFGVEGGGDLLAVNFKLQIHEYHFV